jgi:hypothetical protein
VATLGYLVVGKVVVHTLEDAWKDNQRGVSCIPAGTYKCIPHGWEPDSTVRFKRVWEVTNVPGRSAILFGHPGNSDADTKGCILPGLGNASGVLTSSVSAAELLRKVIGCNPFTLTIIDAGKISVA